MKIAVSAETYPGENRVAATPDTIKAFVKKGLIPQISEACTATDTP